MHKKVNIKLSQKKRPYISLKLISQMKTVTAINNSKIQPKTATLLLERIRRMMKTKFTHLITLRDRNKGNLLAIRQTRNPAHLKS